MKLKQFALTTKDNPFNPFSQFDQWLMFDINQGYNTCELLGRFVKNSQYLTANDNNAEIERAIDSIIFNDFQNLYVKLVDEEEIPDPIYEVSDEELNNRKFNID